VEQNEKERLARFMQAYYFEAGEFAETLLLKGKVRLADIPLHVRATIGVYIAALRVSRNFYNHFTEDLRIIMDDTEKLPRGYQGNFNRNLTESFLKILDDNICGICPFKEVRAFEEFKRNFYEPFLQKMQSGKS